jgi:histidinol-phosphate aminotransferase
MTNLSLPRIQAMEPYNPPLAGRRAFDGLLLDFNERTTPPFQLYPEYGYLEKRLAKYVGVKPTQIMLTNGSDQGIDLIFRTFTQTDDTVIIPSPTFTMFYQSAQIVGNNILRPLYTKENSSFPLEELLEMINESVKLIVICNPNNPTGTLVSIQDIQKIAQSAPRTIILVDEAYFEFSGVTVAPLTNKYSNIIVTRTFSKAFGLASLRIGYIVAATKYIKELLKVRGPYDINMTAYTTALKAIKNLKNMQQYTNEVMTQAKPMVEDFFTKNNISFYLSAANFLLYQPSLRQEAKILETNGILVRPKETMLRLTIGTVDQMKQFIKVYKKYAFLDKDGTLIFEPQDTFQIDSLDKLKILGGVIKGLKQLKKLGYEFIMITNQNGLGTLSFPRANFQAPQNKLLRIFKQNGIKFKKIFVCPHLPSQNCGCRKPKTGLVKKFLRQNLINKDKSFVCGDRPTDQIFAKNIGIKFIPMPTNGNFYNALAQGEVIL